VQARIPPVADTPQKLHNGYAQINFDKQGAPHMLPVCAS
jgi:hypothetical protein